MTPPPALGTVTRMAPDVVLLTTAEIADLFRINRSTVRRWVEDGRLKEVNLSGRVKRYRLSDIEALLAEPAAKDGAP